MNAELLLKHFDRISDAPDAIPRLRQFILELAVRGKLIEQDPNDEPASELLKRIEFEKARLVKQGMIKRQQSLPPIGESSLASGLPTGWAWARLGELSRLVTSGSRDWAEFYSDDGAIFVRMGNLSRGSYRLRLDSIQRVKPPADGEGARTRLEAGDILVSITGEVGLLGLIPEDFGEAYINQHTCMVRPMEPLRGRFLPEFLRSPLAQNQFNEPQRGIKNSFRLTDVTHLMVPVPPLAEQHRIVAKVDELMALCDRLESAQAERESRRDRLAAASLNRLNQPADPAAPEALREHAHFYLNHLPRLTTRPEHIKQLRQTILNLAVRGQLVPQDPNDEPVIELLKRIRHHKGDSSRNTTSSSLEAFRTLSGRDGPYLIPDSWIWVAFGDVTVCRDGERIPVSKEERNGRAKVFDYYGASGVIDKIDDYLFDKPLLLIGEDGANLVNRSTPIAFLASGKYWVNNHAHAIDGISESFLRFMELQINAIDLKPFVTGTAQPKMNQSKMNSIPIALPPELEQGQIVARVTNLMALCDQLDMQIGLANTENDLLLESIIKQISRQISHCDAPVQG